MRKHVVLATMRLKDNIFSVDIVADVELVGVGFSGYCSL